MKSGKSQKQSVAIAFNVAKKAKKAVNCIKALEDGIFETLKKK